MLRDLLRRHLHQRFTILLLIAAAMALAAGCAGFVYPPPTVPEAVQKEMFHISDPIALLTFEPGRTSGKIIGELHDWPFPHLEENQSLPTHNFTYVGQFHVTSKSDEDALPAGAEGTRKVYFHEQMPTPNMADARFYATGQEVALDALSLSFSFKENHKIVAVRMITQQKSARPFAYKGQQISAPKDRDTADTFEGEYSPDLGGYVLHSLNE